MIVCTLATDCIPLYANVKANNYAGIYVSSLYSNLLVKAMEGSVGPDLVRQPDRLPRRGWTT